MADISEFHVQMMPTQVPGAAGTKPSLFGAEGDSIERVGSQLEDIGQTLAAKQKQAQDANYAMTTQLEHMRQLNDYTQRLQLQMPSDYQGYTQQVQQYSQDLFTQGQKNAPSQTAKVMYQRAAEPMFTRALIEARSSEDENLAKSYVTGIQDDIQKNGDSLVTSPFPEYASDLIQSTNQKIDGQVGKSIDASTAAKLKNQSSNQSVRSLLDGLLAKGTGNASTGKTFLQQGIDVINGTTEGSLSGGMTITHGNLSDYLKPGEKAEYLDRFQRALKTQSHVSTAEIMQRYRDNLVQQQQGGPVDPTLFPDIHSMVDAGVITPEKEIRMIDTSNAAYASGQVIHEMKMSNPNTWKSIADTWDSKLSAIVSDASTSNPALKAAQQPGFNAEDRSEQKRLVAAAGAKILKARREDPYQYVLDNSPSAKLVDGQAAFSPSATLSSIRQNLALQKTIGIGQMGQRVSSKSQTTQFGQVMETSDPKQAAGILATYQQKYGPYFRNFMAEAVQDKHVDPQMQLVADKTDPFDREQAAAIVINGKKMADAYKSNHNATDERSLKENVQSLVQPYATALSQIGGNTGGGAYQAESVSKFVLTDAMNRVNNGTDPEDAAKQAFQSYTASNSLVSASNSSVVAPKEVNGNTVAAFINSHMDKDGFRALNVQPSGDPDKFYSNLSDLGHWVTNPDKQGIHLEIWLPNGHREPVRSKDNQVVSMSYQDIVNHPDPLTMEQQKLGIVRFWDRLTGNTPKAKEDVGGQTPSLSGPKF